MSGAVHTCPRCQAELTPGVIRTTTRETGFQPFAISGSNRVRWVGNDKQQFRVEAFRCATCGYVELSATEPPATSGCMGVILLLAGLGIGVYGFAAQAAGVGRQPATAFRVFADLEHTGKLTGPLTNAPKAARAFGIVAPLPTNCAERDLLTESFAQRLGQLRVEAKEGNGASLAIEGEPAATLRLYRKTDAGWQRIAPTQGASWTLTADRFGILEVGVGIVLPEVKADADVPAWPAAFTLKVGTTADDGVRVHFRVTPFLIPSPLDPVEELLVVSHAATGNAVKALETFAANAKLKLHVHQAKPPCDQWMQDTIEPGVFAFPAAEKAGQARAALCGLRKEFRRASEGLDRQIGDWLREDGLVAVVPGIARKNTRWIDWYGNLEVTPPHTDRNGRRFPYGRIITGQQRDLAMHPGVMKFLEAQRMQWPPIVVDTSWLLIGHLDEAVNFVPAKTAAGFKVVLPSPKAARDLLDGLLAKGLGDTPVFEKTRDETTVSKLREEVAISKENVAIDETIAAIRKQLQKELNLEEADFVLLPALFERGLAMIPNAVNSAVVNGHVLAPAPRGPHQDGKDVFEEAIRAALAGCEVRVIFVDAWRAFHVSGGEVHCGTNTFRRLRDPAWWEHVDPPNSGK